MNIEVNRILVVIDPTVKEQPCLTRATEFARKFESHLELFICDYNQYLSGERFFDSPGLKRSRESFIDERRERLEREAKRLASAGYDVSFDACWDHPLHDGIVRKVIESKPDLVFKDTHYHSKLQRVLFTNTDWHLIRDCPAPLMLIKLPVDSDRRAITAAVDPLHEHDKPATLDHKILRYARALAAGLGTVYHVAHSYNPIAVTSAAGAPVAQTVGTGLPLDDIEAGVRAEHERELNKLLEQYDLPEDHVHLLSGATSDSLENFVESVEARVLIMGALARNALKRIFVGSTAEKVLGDVNCDVLILKPDDFVSPVEAD